MKKNIIDKILALFGLVMFVSGMAVVSDIFEREAYSIYQIYQTASVGQITQGSYWYGHNLNVDTNNMFKSNPEKDISKDKKSESGSSLRSIVTSRYCTNGKLFTGKIKANPNSGGWGNGEAWIGVEVDKDFIDNILVKQRKINKDSIPLTPIYDLVVKIIPDFNYHCFHEYPEKAVTYNDLPETVEVKGSIQVDGEKFLSGGIFTKTPDTGLGPEGYTYQWKIRGWPYGIVSKDKIERLIEVIASPSTKDDPVFVLEMRNLDNKLVKEEVSPLFNLCVPVGGKGRIRIAYLKSFESGLNLPSLLFKTDDIIKDGFEIIDPFKTYKNNFSHFVDIKTLDYAVMGNLPKDPKKVGSYLGTLPSKINCINTSQVFFYVGDSIDLGEGSGALGLTDLFNPSILLTDKVQSLVAIHETGHALAGLIDEVAWFIGLLGDSSLSFQRNCSGNPSVDYKYNDKLYGDLDTRGCNSVWGRPRNDQEIDYVFRPSKSSIMNASSPINKFNVVSCGYILSVIDGGNPKANFDRCMKMDTIKPSVSIMFSKTNKSNLNGSSSHNNTMNNGQTNLNYSNSIPTKGKCYIKLSLNIDNINNSFDFKLNSINYTSDNLSKEVFPSMTSNSYYTVETYKAGVNTPYGTYAIPTSKTSTGFFADNFDKKESYYFPGYDDFIQIVLPSDGNLSKINIRRGDVSKTIYTNKKMLNCGERASRGSFFDIFNLR